MKILHVVGARPNFMKLAPLHFDFTIHGISQLVVHTGQHYSHNMSEIFFRDLGLPAPDINLEIGSGTHAEQVANIMLRLEKILLTQKPDWVFVYGDVNSTVAAALVSAKILIPVAHVEAGLRSFDRTMPEELNRIVTDQLSDLHLIPSLDARDNLLKEGIAEQKIHFVGNIMIDTLTKVLALPQNTATAVPDRFGLVTLHRPSNVDHPDRMRSIMSVLASIAAEIPLIFPVHPRTQRQIDDIWNGSPNLLLREPLGYRDFIHLLQKAKFVITDSGGIQEETTFLKVPCLTLRSNTERPVTVSMGSNTLIGDDFELLRHCVFDILHGRYKANDIPPLWDGRTANRITQIFLKPILGSECSASDLRQTQLD